METAFNETEKSSRIIYEWLTSKEAAAYLKISVKTLRNESYLGRIKYYKHGRRNRYLRSDLNDLLFQGEVKR